MRLLFLGIDGVLNTVQGNVYHYLNDTHTKLIFRNPKVKNDDGTINQVKYDQELSRDWCPIAVSNLRLLLNVFEDLRIVVSSSWKIVYKCETMPDLFIHYPEIKERVIGRTSDINVTLRGEEIRHYRETKGYHLNPYCIIDMGNLFTDCQQPYLITTDTHVGIDYNTMIKAVHVLGGTEAMVAAAVMRLGKRFETL